MSFTDTVFYTCSLAPIIVAAIAQRYDMKISSPIASQPNKQMTTTELAKQTKYKKKLKRIRRRYWRCYFPGAVLAFLVVQVLNKISSKKVTDSLDRIETAMKKQSIFFDEKTGKLTYNEYSIMKFGGNVENSSFDHLKMEMNIYNPGYSDHKHHPFYNDTALGILTKDVEQYCKQQHLNTMTIWAVDSTVQYPVYQQLRDHFLALGFTEVDLIQDARFKNRTITPGVWYTANDIIITLDSTGL